MHRRRLFDDGSALRFLVTFRRATVRLGRLLSIFRFVERRVLRFLLRMTDEALRVGPIVLLAPVVLRFESCDKLRMALRAFFLRHAMLIAPPAFMRMFRRRNRLRGR